MTLRAIVIATLVSVALEGCTSVPNLFTQPRTPQETYAEREALYDPIISVFRHNGAAGYGRWYFFTPEFVALVITNDFNYPYEEVYRRSLTIEEAGNIREFVRSRDFARMKPIYIDPRIYDGLNVQIKFHLDTGITRVVSIQNGYDSYVFETFTFLDQYLDDEHKIGIANAQR